MFNPANALPARNDALANRRGGARSGRSCHNSGSLAIGRMGGSLIQGFYDDHECVATMQKPTFVLRTAHTAHLNIKARIFVCAVSLRLRSRVAFHPRNTCGSSVKHPRFSPETQGPVLILILILVLKLTLSPLGFRSA